MLYFCVPTFTDYIYPQFDFTINDQPAGRVTFRLYDDVAPMTSRNFRELATGQHGFGYAGSAIHRIIPGVRSLPNSLRRHTDGWQFDKSILNTFVM